MEGYGQERFSWETDKTDQGYDGWGAVLCEDIGCIALSGSFETRKGLRQGDGLSCLLFNIALEGVIRRAAFNMRGTIFSRSSQFICFADDVDIVGRTFEAVAEQYTR